MSVYDISEQPLHLGLGATAKVQPVFTGSLDWYEAYVTRNLADGREGRLVASHHFTESWTSWEMHPEGDEVVLCLAGALTLHQEFPDGRLVSVPLTIGHYAINPPGVWHTADIAEVATALFITAGVGTVHRAR